MSIFQDIEEGESIVVTFGKDKNNKTDYLTGNLIDFRDNIITISTSYEEIYYINFDNVRYVRKGRD